MFQWLLSYAHELARHQSGLDRTSLSRFVQCSQNSYSVKKTLFHKNKQIRHVFYIATAAIAGHIVPVCAWSKSQCNVLAILCVCVHCESGTICNLTSKYMQIDIYTSVDTCTLYQLSSILHVYVVQ